MRSLLVIAMSFASITVAQTAQAQVAGSAEVSAEGSVRARSSSSSVRLGLQGRLDALNLVLFDDGFPPTVPIVTAGVRFVDQRLWLGAGFGFYNEERGDDGFSFSPLASFDVLKDDLAALSLVGWLTFGDRSDVGGFNDVFFWGSSFGVGVRGKISDGLAIGSEWGWGFMNLDIENDPGDPRDDEDLFVHGMFGTILFEATVGL